MKSASAVDRSVRQNSCSIAQWWRRANAGNSDSAFSVGVYSTRGGTSSYASRSSSPASVSSPSRVESVFGAMSSSASRSLKLLARAALEDARDHVEAVRASGTRWTVVRGPRLTEDPHTGAFRYGTNLSLGMRDTAARANVAEFVLDCLEEERYVGEMPKIADER